MHFREVLEDRCKRCHVQRESFDHGGLGDLLLSPEVLFQGWRAFSVGDLEQLAQGTGCRLVLLGDALQVAPHLGGAAESESIARYCGGSPPPSGASGVRNQADGLGLGR